MRRIFALLVVLALAAAACGDGGADTTTTQAATTTTTTAATTTTEAATTTTTEAAGVAFTGADGVESVITDTSRIVSLNGDLTEIIWDLGLGDQVVAIDVTTTYPEEAAALPPVGFGRQLAAEAVLAFSPTLVIGDQQIAPPEAIEQIRGTGVPVVILETRTSIDDVADKVRQVAEILGVPDAGETLATRVDAEIAAAEQRATAATDHPRVAFLYVRGPETLLLFGAGMVTQDLIESAGGVDAGADSGIAGAVPLTPEALVAAAPDVIISPAGGVAALGGVEDLAALPGVAETPAGQNGRFLLYDEAAFLGLGPRTGEALDQLVSDLHPDLAG